MKRNLLDAACLETIFETDHRLIGSLPYASILLEAVVFLAQLVALRSISAYPIPQDKVVYDEHAKSPEAGPEAALLPHQACNSLDLPIFVGEGRCLISRI